MMSLMDAPLHSSSQQPVMARPVMTIVTVYTSSLVGSLLKVTRHHFCFQDYHRKHQAGVQSTLPGLCTVSVL